MKIDLSISDSLVEISPPIGRISRKRIYYTVLMIYTIVFTVIYQFKIRNYNFWEDETETIVVSKMMASGLELYSYIFDQHGPLVFLFGYVIEKFGYAEIIEYRTLIYILQWIMLALILCHFQHMDLRNRALSLLASCVWLECYLPQEFGNTYLYQVMAGLMTATAMAIFVIPSLVRPEGQRHLSCFAGGFFLGCLPFLAFTYLPPALLLTACAFRRSKLYTILLGIISAFACNILFLVLKGSLTGFVADHIYLNVRILPMFGIANLIEILRESRRGDLAFAALASCAVMALGYYLYGIEKIRAWRISFLCLCLLWYFFRGFWFQALPIYYSIIPIIFVLTPISVNMISKIPFATDALVCLCLIKLSLILPWDIRRIEDHQIPPATLFSEIVRKNTEPADKIISYSFSSYNYIAARRLPASGAFFFLPWQERYNEHPIFGISSNPCLDINKNRPKLVKLDKWSISERFPWSQYGRCIDDLMASEYDLLPRTDIYIRKDLRDTVKLPDIPEENRQVAIH